MKKQIFFLAVTATALASCGNSHTESTEATHDSIAETIVYMADTAASTINWKGEVAGVYGHTGNIALKSGSISLAGDSIVAGEFEVNMTTIAATDSASFKAEKGHTIADLEGHLEKADFFAVDSFPTSKFVITSVEGNNVKGNLTIRNKTHEETFVVESKEVVDGVVTIKGSLVFNRQNYGVAWVHFMKDMVLSNDIALTYTFVAKH
jgi:polyisoprenoid-binding protein YceI